MFCFQINSENLVIKRASLQDLNKVIKNAIINSVVLLILLILIVVSVAQYGIDPLATVLGLSMFFLIGIVGLIYNSGRLLGLFPKQPINIHTWIAIYMGRRIGSADIR